MFFFGCLWFGWGGGAIHESFFFFFFSFRFSYRFLGRAGVAPSAGFLSGLHYWTQELGWGLERHMGQKKPPPFLGVGTLFGLV